MISFKANPTRLLFTLFSLGLLQPVIAQTNRDAVLLFTYFRYDGVDGVHLALSNNGVDFVALNDDKAVFTPPQWPGQNLTRDASILYHDLKKWMHVKQAKFPHPAQHGTLFLAPGRVVGSLVPTISTTTGL